jgi:hypothetical protein
MTFHRTLGAALAVLLALPAMAQAPTPRPIDHEHTAWSALLSQYVRDGEVDYGGLKERGLPALEAYLRALEAVSPADYSGFTREQRLAFWVNAYNAYMARLILKHHPLKSVRKIGLLPLAAFRERFIPIKAVGDEVMSLNDIEHTQLREKLDEPRIHFALVCASKSCPKLRSEAYRASTIDAQLDAAARDFMADGFRNRIDPASGTAEVSSIFKWYRGDFTKGGRTLGAYMAQYAEPAVADFLLKKGDAMEFLDYDWSLNGR